MSHCPCGSEKTYENCCELIHLDQKSAKTAESLMRARYSAFVKDKIEFIDQTNSPGTTDFNVEDAKRWANESNWDRLEVVKTQAGTEKDDEGLVEFKACYSDMEKNNHVHHEIGAFKRIENIWYYMEGKILGLGTLKRDGPKIGRNDPCPCESGKKFKKCCGKN